MTDQPAKDSQGRGAEIRTEFLDQRKQYLEAEAKAAEQFDKAILTLSAGALALSMTFIKDIVPADQRLHPELIAVGWLFFIGSICATLGSFLTSQRVYHVGIKVLDAKYLGKEAKPNRWIGFTTTLNFISMGCFAVGVVFVCGFVFCNFK